MIEINKNCGENSKFDNYMNVISKDMREKIGDLSYATWLEYGVKRAYLEDNKLVWPMDNEFTMEIVKERYGWTLMKVIKSIFGNDIKLEFLVIEIEGLNDRDNDEILTRVEKIPFTKTPEETINNIFNVKRKQSQC